MKSVVLLLLLISIPASSQSGYWAPVTSCSAGMIHALLTLPGGDLFAATDYDGLLFHSTDQGVTWHASDSGLTQYTSVQALVRDSSGGILAGTPDGVFRSTDNGMHWVRAGFMGRGVNSLAVRQDGTLFAAVSGGVYRSTNGGASWGVSDTTIQPRTYKCLTIAHDGSILCGSLPMLQFGTAGLRRSTDNGVSWSDVTDGLFDDRIRSLTTAPSGDLFLGIDTGGVYRSTDAGATWYQTSLLTHAIYALAEDEGGNLFAATNDAGIFHSTNDGETWLQVNGGLTTMSVSALAFDANHYLFAGTDGYGVFKSVSPLTSANDPPRVLPASFALHQNFPNPFNPSTTIRYDLPARASVRLSVFDILGREVAVLVDRTEDAGVKSVVWNAGSLPSGVYVMRLRAGASTAASRLVLAK